MADGAPDISTVLTNSLSPGELPVVALPSSFPSLRLRFSPPKSRVGYVNKTKAKY